MFKIEFSFLTLMSYSVLYIKASIRAVVTKYRTTIFVRSLGYSRWARFLINGETAHKASPKGNYSTLYCPTVTYYFAGLVCVYIWNIILILIANVVLIVLVSIQSWTQAILSGLSCHSLNRIEVSPLPYNLLFHREYNTIRCSCKI